MNNEREGTMASVISLYRFFIKSPGLTFRSWLRQQFQHYIVVGDLFGYSGILHELLFGGDTYVMFPKQLLELLESLQCRGKDG